MPSYFPDGDNSLSMWPSATDEPSSLLHLQQKYAARYEARQQATEAKQAQQQQAQLEEAKRTSAARRAAVHTTAVPFDPILAKFRTPTTTKERYDHGRRC